LSGGIDFLTGKAQKRQVSIVLIFQIRYPAASYILHRNPKVSPMQSESVSER
jgi:hypothetical protein